MNRIEADRAADGLREILVRATMTAASYEFNRLKSAAKHCLVRLISLTKYLRYLSATWLRWHTPIWIKVNVSDGRFKTQHTSATVNHIHKFSIS